MISNLNSVVLHPKYKLTYFQSKKWPEEWVDAARLVLREQWMTYYKPSDSEELGSQSSTSNAESVSSTRILEYAIGSFNYLLDHARESLCCSWRFRHWYYLWWTRRVPQHPNNIYEESWPSCMVVCNWHFKSAGSHGDWLFISTQ